MGEPRGGAQGAAMNYAPGIPLASDGIDRFIGTMLRGSLSRGGERIGSTSRAGTPTASGSRSRVCGGGFLDELLLHPIMTRGAPKVS